MTHVKNIIASALLTLSWLCPAIAVCAAGGVTVMDVTGAATVTGNVGAFAVSLAESDTVTVTDSLPLAANV